MVLSLHIRDPVSYTHLKQSGEYSIGELRGYFYDEGKFRSSTEAPAKPVSYTHLDVYKRQALSSLTNFSNDSLSMNSSYGIDFICGFLVISIPKLLSSRHKQGPEPK